MLSHLLRAFGRSERGNVAILFALASVPLFGIAGMALDYSRASSERTRLQNVLDGAVLAGAAATGTEVASAQQFFNAGVARYDMKGAGASFTFSSTSGLAGTAHAEVPTTLLKIATLNDLTVGVSASAKKNAGAGGSVCILALDPTATQSFLANSGAKINGPDCEIHVRSTANPAAIVNSGTTLAVKKVCVKGANTIQNGGPYPVVSTSCAAIDDPFASKMPAVTVPTACTYNGTNYNANGADVTLPTGNHCSVNINSPRNLYLQPGMFQNININGTPTSINFAPGLYIIKGKLNVNGGTINGSGVTFYYADANSYIQFNSGVTSNLTAPTSGTYKGILFFEPPNLSKSQFAVNDTHGTALQGLIYWPSRNVTINSTSALTADKVSMVVNQIILNNTNWKFTPNTDWPMTSTGGSGASTVLLTQ